MEFVAEGLHLNGEEFGIKGLRVLGCSLCFTVQG